MKKFSVEIEWEKLFGSELTVSAENIEEAKEVAKAEIEGLMEIATEKEEIYNEGLKNEVVKVTDISDHSYAKDLR